jgi:cytosine/adenosine deaminase-related metal-dependent hydrolase
MASEWSLTARWVFPVDAPPLERGVITIAGDRIHAVELHGTRTADYDLGNAAILPGLVNAHTHLDLSGLRGKCPPTPEFTHWLRRVVSHRRNQLPTQIASDISEGIEECAAFGTTLLGDIAQHGASSLIITDRPIRTVVFYEVIGLSTERAREAWEGEVAKNLRFPGQPIWWDGKEALDICRFGVSPHAPYSVREWLFRRIAARARNHPFPVAIHLAETAEERELLEKRTGPFVSFLTEMGVWDPSGLVRNFEEVLQLFAGVRSTLFVHCNYLPPVAALPTGGTIVYCPRTHAAFGHPPHPFREFLARGVRVALGTDSLASNPDLDVLAEARFVHAKHPDVAGDVLLRMLTLSGAEALGWADETGSLTPGKSADLIVLPLPNVEARDSYQLVLESTSSVRAVLFRGTWTRRPDEIPT